VARGGQRHVAEPAVRARPLAADQAFAFGPGDALRDGPGADQAQLGDGPRGEPVRRARPAQGGQQVQGGGVDAEPGQGAAALVGEQLADPPDPGDNADGPGRGPGALALPGVLDAVDVVLAGLIAETDNGRPGTTADVATLVAFLASPSAGHLTGQVIHVNGGAYLGR
jgi:hypothetical protein